MKLPYPIIRQHDADTYMLVEDYIGVLPDGRKLFIAKDFIYDGNSIPRAFWSIIGSPFRTEHTRAGFIHDALYCSELVPRAEADEIFLEIMKECGVGWLKRNTAYSAVSLFGGSVWAKHNKDDVLVARRNIYFVD